MKSFNWVEKYPELASKIQTKSALKEQLLLSEAIATEFATQAGVALELPFLKSEFFTSAKPTKDLYHRWHALHTWNSDCLPLGEWDGHLYVGFWCDLPHLPENLNVIPVVVNVKDLENLWREFNMEEHTVAANETAAAPAELISFEATHVAPVEAIQVVDDSEKTVVAGSAPAVEAATHAITFEIPQPKEMPAPQPEVVAQPQTVAAIPDDTAEIAIETPAMVPEAPPAPEVVEDPGVPQKPKFNVVAAQEDLVLKHDEGTSDSKPDEGEGLLNLGEAVPIKLNLADIPNIIGGHEEKAEEAKPAAKKEEVKPAPTAKPEPAEAKTVVTPIKPAMPAEPPPPPIPNSISPLAENSRPDISLADKTEVRAVPKIIENFAAKPVEGFPLSVVLQKKGNADSFLKSLQQMCGLEYDTVGIWAIDPTGKQIYSLGDGSQLQLDDANFFSLVRRTERPYHGSPFINGWVKNFLDKNESGALPKTVTVLPLISEGRLLGFGYFSSHQKNHGLRTLNLLANDFQKASQTLLTSSQKAA